MKEGTKEQLLVVTTSVTQVNATCEWFLVRRIVLTQIEVLQQPFNIFGEFVPYHTLNKIFQELISVLQ